MTPRTLIIKKGATGDVVRTTVLLHILDGEVTWVTEAYNREVLPQQHPALRHILSMDEAESLRGAAFDRVISLDDDPACAELAASVQAGDLMGTFLQDGTVRYTGHFGDWFDMSLVSVYGKERADELKLLNRKTYQQMLFAGFGRTFADRDTCLVNEAVRRQPASRRVGIEARAGARWPTKAWHAYPELAGRLTGEGWTVNWFEQRPTLPEYMRDIASCSMVVTGDTLAMHVALALGIPVVAIFTCTSPWEIHGYSIMEKVVSPGLAKAFYRNEYFADVVEAVSVDAVHAAFRRLAG